MFYVYIYVICVYVYISEHIDMYINHTYIYISCYMCIYICRCRPADVLHRQPLYGVYFTELICNESICVVFNKSSIIYIIYPLLYLHQFYTCISISCVYVPRLQMYPYRNRQNTIEICVDVYMCIRVYVCMCICAYECVYVCVYVSMSMRVYVYVYAYMCIYIYVELP